MTRQMKGAKKMAAKKRKKAGGKIKYKQITVETFYTDGQRELANFSEPDKFFRHIERKVSEDYIDSIRVELF